MSTDPFQATRVIQRQLDAMQRAQAPRRQLQEAIAPAYAFRREWQQVLTTQAILAKRFAPDQTVMRTLVETQDRFRELTRGLPDLTKTVSAVFAQYHQLTEPFAITMREIGRVGRIGKRIEAAGWLPHYTTPMEAIEELEDADAVDACLAAYYADHWDEVEAAFLSRVDAYDLDDEVKAAFREALECHRRGLYRATVRTLFPELERVTRRELHDGRPEGLASLPSVRKGADSLTLHDVEPNGLYAMGLFAKLLDHLYAQARTEDQLAAIAADPTPNRHAALHGLVVYSTQRSSVNALIMADFILQVICALKAADAAAPEADAA